MTVPPSPAKTRSNLASEHGTIPRRGAGNLNLHPTHHGRASTLRTTLESMFAQLGDASNFEVCVSDGGTADGTAEIIAELQARRCGWLKYRRSEIDHGFAHHLIDAVAMADGGYCWLFSSDDAIEPGGIELVSRALREQPDLIALTCSVAMYDAALARLITDEPQFFYPPESDRPHRYGGAAEITAALGVIFAYFPAHIVRRDAWVSSLAEQRNSGRELSRYFPHMDVFGGMIRSGASWAWLPARVIRNRGENDSWTPRVFGGDVSKYWVAILADLSRLYSELGEGDPHIRRRLLSIWIETIAKGEDLARYRLAPGAGWRRDLAMLVGFARTLWRCPLFWRNRCRHCSRPGAASPRLPRSSLECMQPRTVADDLVLVGGGRID